MTSSLEEVRRLATADSGLAAAVTVGPDGTPHASVVNAGFFRILSTASRRSDSWPPAKP